MNSVTNFFKKIVNVPNNDSFIKFMNEQNGGDNTNFFNPRYVKVDEYITHRIVRVKHYDYDEIFCFGEERYIGKFGRWKKLSNVTYF